jgi:hypothetical protein
MIQQLLPQPYLQSMPSLPSQGPSHFYANSAAASAGSATSNAPMLSINPAALSQSLSVSASASASASTSALQDSLPSSVPQLHHYASALVSYN